MPQFAWEPFLLEWEREAFASQFYRDALPFLPAEVAQRQTLRNAGASEEQLRALERRLGAALPPSYREFLAYTNGWRQVGLIVERLWSTDDVAWFSVRNQEWIDAWRGLGDSVSDEAYLDYRTDRAASLRDEYLDTLLEVSDTENVPDAYVLNPQIVTTTGEWEAWRLGEDFARFPSFWDLMRLERKIFHELA